MGGIDFTMLSNSFIFCFKLLVLPNVRVSQHHRWALFEQFSRFLSIKPPVALELIFESDSIVLRELRVS